MLTGRQLVNQNIISGLRDDKQIQQVGVDARLMEVERILDEGCILESQTRLPTYEKLELTTNDAGVLGWWLQPNEIYSIRLDLGCQIPDNVALFIRQRSSVLRMGGVLHSSVFDPGYNCPTYSEGVGIGTVMFTMKKIFIEHKARVGQIYGSYINEAVQKDDLYGSSLKGSQWQGGK